jgi:hypothetical protein
MIQYKEANTSIKRHKWEIAQQVVGYYAWKSVGKCAKAKYISNRLIAVVDNEVWLGVMPGPNYMWVLTGWQLYIDRDQPRWWHNRDMYFSG